MKYVLHLWYIAYACVPEVNEMCVAFVVHCICMCVCEVTE